MKKAILIMSFLVLLSGCTDDKTNQISQSVIPEANDENCTDAVFNTIKNKLERDAFKSACFHRSKFVPSPKVQW
ncbi:MAG: entry exclusion lipoprotein TrbK [Hydrotalea sp. AMD]|uniref:entry exclusion lipoprotein TrbK n=1 Tax=Hydrotalea sp. AMD TaxID=2501297 RepID=UPI001025E0B5|nr:MAG: entry exclusion lipoprotein TrbK [Hydrotalea sp. AMD]